MAFLPVAFWLRKILSIIAASASRTAGEACFEFGLERGVAQESACPLSFAK
jgi:hypothetical protein